jgi:hypothetical protein
LPDDPTSFFEQLLRKYELEIRELREQEIVLTEAYLQLKGIHFPDEDLNPNLWLPYSD